MFNIYIFLIFIATVSSIILMIYAVAHHSSDRAFFLIFLSICTFLFTFGYLLEITSPTLEAAFIGIRIQKMGTPFIVLLNYLFVRDVYGDKRFNIPILFLLFALPLFNLITFQAFPLIRLHYTDIEYFSNGFIANCQGYPGTMSHIANGYNFIVVIFNLRRIIKHMRGVSKLKKQQSVSLLASILIPLFTYIYHILSYNQLRLDINPFAVSVSLALLLYSVRIQNLLNVVPLARAQVIESMADAFIVCDKDFTFLDANQAAKQLFPELSTLSPGETMKEVKYFKTESEICLQVDEEMRFYQISKTPILQSNKNGGICIVLHDITKKENQLKKLYDKANFDPLMHIYNRATFFDLADFTLSSEIAKEQPHALLMIDLDQFKVINDTYGHPCGDVVLETIAGKVKSHFRRSDMVGRYGGEEIVVLLQDISVSYMVTVVEKLRTIIENTRIPCRENELNVTVSIGMAHSPAGKSHSLQEMLTQADLAMYEAKKSGGNRVCLYKTTEISTK